MCFVVVVVTLFLLVAFLVFSDHTVNLAPQFLSRQAFYRKVARDLKTTCVINASFAPKPDICLDCDKKRQLDKDGKRRGKITAVLVELCQQAANGTHFGSLSLSLALHTIQISKVELFLFWFK